MAHSYYLQSAFMQGTINRSQFLSGDFSGVNRPVRPPWALEEALFVDRCTRCSECISACPYNIIKEGRGKFPQLNFSLHGCDFCRKCVDVCEPKALDYDPVVDSRPWDLTATILPACLSLNAVICRSCGEACEERAISFKLELGGIARPNLDAESCTGCGECFAVCPIKAVEISPAGPDSRAA